MSFLFGSGGQSPQPFRGPGYEQQGQVLGDLFMGNLLGSKPGYLEGQRGAVSSLQGQLDALNQRRGALESNAGLGSPYRNQLLNELGRQTSPIEEQLRAAQQTLGFGEQASLNVPQLPQETTLQFGGNRDPFQFQNNFNANVGDFFTPQIEMANRALQRQGEDQRLGIMEDMNRRGLLTTGATTGALLKQRESEQNALQNVASQAALQQAQAQMGANQFAAQMDMNRQIQQAAEIFRQQGASDQQALQLAQNAFQRFGVDQGLQRQPIEDLMRLYQFSTGASPGSPSTPGLLQSVLPAVGLALATGGLGSMFGAGAGAASGAGASGLLGSMPFI